MTKTERYESLLTQLFADDREHGLDHPDWKASYRALKEEWAFQKALRHTEWREAA